MNEELYLKLFDAVLGQLSSLLSNSVISFSNKNINIDLVKVGEFIDNKIDFINSKDDDDYSYQDSLILSTCYFIDALIEKFEEENSETISDLIDEDSENA